MISNQLFERIFSYPKFSILDSLTIEKETVQLNEEVRIWLEDFLFESFNDSIQSITCHRVRPWSQVFKVETNRNKLYFLKIPTFEFQKEAQIVGLIESLFPDITTKVLVQNKINGSFFSTAIEGETLRIKIRKQFDELIFEDCASIIGGIQRKLKHFISDFEQLDIPIWTSTAILENCNALIRNPRFLINSSLSMKELDLFRFLFPSILEKLDVLTELDDGLSIEHGDFQDNNIFISKDAIHFMDWADACISMPSFTIGTYCHSILLAHSNITDRPKLIQRILENYYFNLKGSNHKSLNEVHLLLVHFLYPIICTIKAGRLLNIKDNKLDKYTTAIVDYWIRIIISFRSAYCNETLSNEII